MSAVVRCVRCGQCRCEQRYWLLRYEFHRAVDIEEFAEDFQGVAVSSGLQIRRVGMRNVVSRRRAKLVHGEVGGEGEGIWQELSVTVGASGRSFSFGGQVHGCDVAMERILGVVQKMRDVGGLPLVEKADGYDAAWLMDWC